MNYSELFWNVSQAELRQGYVENEFNFVCLLCGTEIEKGIVYSEEETLYEPERYMRVHIEKVHGSVFNYLVNLDKKLTGLTDHQSRLMRLFYQGKSDDEIREELNIGSASTIRNHRFTLREKERQAKVFLTLMALLEERDNHAPAFISVHKTARMVDDRYNITVEEKDKILAKYFPDGTDGQLTTFAVKEKNKLVILKEIIKKFERGVKYHEKEVNAIIKPIYEDYVTIRRYLIEYGFMDRNRDGSAYWVI